MIAEKGLPSLPSATITEEVRKAETTRKLVLNADSSGGRVIRIQHSAQPAVQPVAPQPASPNVPQPAPHSAQPQGQPEKH
jgi:hypothetical protein